MNERRRVLHSFSLINFESSSPAPTIHSSITEIRKSKSDYDLSKASQEQQSASGFRQLGSLLSSQNNRIISEKQKLKELNSRLRHLLDTIKYKKDLNDALIRDISTFKSNVTSIYTDERNEERMQRNNYNHCLIDLKKQLNFLSECNYLAKAKFTRCQASLLNEKIKIEEEIKLSHQDQEKIEMLERKKLDTQQELSMLKNSTCQINQTIRESDEANARIEMEISSLNSRLDRELEQKLDLEGRIQTLLEQKRFDLQVFNTIKQELLKLFERGHQDPNEFVLNELANLKHKIRQDFCEYNQDTHKQTVDEYESRYFKSVEEIETMIQEENSIVSTHGQLKDEYNRNLEIIEKLRAQEFHLNKLTSDLSEKLEHNKRHVDLVLKKKAGERAIALETIENLKRHITSSLINTKCLNNQVTTFASTLNHRIGDSSNQVIKNEVVIKTATTTTTPPTINPNCRSGDSKRCSKINNFFVKYGIKQEGSGGAVNHCKRKCSQIKQSQSVNSVDNQIYFYRPKSDIVVQSDVMSSSHQVRCGSGGALATHSPMTCVKTETQLQVKSRSQSPVFNRPNQVQHVNNCNNRYAIKHKANRYVSGAIGILETSLNGEYIVLENLSANKSVNLNGWYIHRYVPDKSVNIIYKFTNESLLLPSQKAKIIARSSHHCLSPADADFKIIVAENIDNWGCYSKFSVTKLINPDGVDKAVLTTSLLRLSSSTNLLNKALPDGMQCIKESESSGGFIYVPSLKC